MAPTRAMGAGCFALALYWLQFYLRRHDPPTLAQLTVLLCAGVLLVLQERPASPRAVWFRGTPPRPTSAPGWLSMAGALTLAAVLFIAMDAGSHSASDTLHRILPTCALIAAVLARLVAEHAAGRRAAPNQNQTHLGAW